MRTKIILGLIIAIVAAGLLLSDAFKSSSAVDGAEAEMEVSASRLAADYAAGETQANEKYLGKILQVSGEIIEIESGTPLTVVLKGEGMTSVRVEMNDASDQVPEAGQKITVAGSCTGMLLDVILNNGTIIDTK